MFCDMNFLVTIKCDDGLMWWLLIHSWINLLHLLQSKLFVISVCEQGKEKVSYQRICVGCSKFPVFNYHQTLQHQNIRCSIIGLAAEVRVCRTLCSETQGRWINIQTTVKSLTCLQCITLDLMLKKSSFQLSVIKLKPKQPLWPITKGAENSVNQSKLDINRVM